MPVGTCQECGADEVRCKGLCTRCYAASYYRRVGRGGRPSRAALVTAARAAALEEAWRAHQTLRALMAEAPNAGRGPTWKALAACRDHRDMAWAGNRVTIAMRAVCGACPVRDRCLAEAMADPAVGGVWAATTAAQRARLRRSSSVRGPGAGGGRR